MLAFSRQYYAMHAPGATAWLVSSLVLVGCGQLAALSPALRAAHVPPVVATKSV